MASDTDGIYRLDRITSTFVTISATKKMQGDLIDLIEKTPGTVRVLIENNI